MGSLPGCKQRTETVEQFGSALLTMEDSGRKGGTQEQRLLARFSCNYAASLVRRILPSKSLEPPSKASNLSPIPIPRSQADGSGDLASRRGGSVGILLGRADRAAPGLHMIAGNIERLGADAAVLVMARSPSSTSTWAVASPLRFGRRSIQSRPQPITAPARQELSYEHERKRDG
jgi:hypothetical protein